MQIAYVLLLFVGAIPVALSRRDTLLLGWGVVYLNWIAGMVYVISTGDTSPAPFFLLEDVASAAVILRFVPMPLLGGSYVGQIIMHLLYIGGNAEPFYYWQVLTVIGFGQILCLVVAALVPPFGRAACEPC